MSSTINAMKEFLTHADGMLISCASLRFEGEVDEHFNLYQDYTPEELEVFLRSIDFNYTNGYGSQGLFGYIWYKDGSWSSREEYDGSEWWEHNDCPVRPERPDR